jgi:N-acetylmuramoyl-L-alanine amidase
VTRQQRGAGGTEVYFLSEARTEEAREVARRENEALAFEENGTAGNNGNSVLRDIFEGMSSDQYLKESQDLAAEIRGAVARTGGMLKDRGVKQAGFYVMKGTQARMPSVLVEMAFISSPREERLLKTESFQKQLAGAIFEGVQAFKEKAEQAVANK